MIDYQRWFLTLATTTFLLISCSDDNGGPVHDTDRSDSDAEDVVVDWLPDTPTEADVSPEDTIADFDVTDSGLDEFPIREPESHPIPCLDFEGNPYQETFYDQDMVCRFAYETIEAEFYLQATPTGCNSTGFPYPTFDDEGSTRAWIEDDGTITEVPAAYSFGGNHAVDWVAFEYAGHSLRMYHSSLGFGGRTCQPPDCLQVCQSDTPCTTSSDVVEDGCHREADSGPPPLPGACVRVNADGTVPPLLDPWIEHDEDPDYPILPCSGDMGSPPF